MVSGYCLGWGLGWAQDILTSGGQGYLPYLGPGSVANPLCGQVRPRPATIIATVKFCGPPLALDRDVFPRPSKKVAHVQAKPLQNLENLAHTVDKRFVLAFPAEVPISPLEFPPTAEETLIQLDCLLSWCCPVLKQLANQQKNVGHMKSERSNLRPGEIGNQNLQPVVSQVANSSGPGVLWPETIGFQSSPVETSEEGIRGNAHPESSEGS
ncbi:hypothetical protein DSO57_1036439 [Entomophthora muscae]|uniref:Uncharacterized protein n=1 Tax=Entomophthora muscae TaxID=34485 RepID=A0ACC2SC82_9FUNG|nr:hypothetical protein DSO57_1036439 [Entomophthora muscae]